MRSDVAEAGNGDELIAALGQLALLQALLTNEGALSPCAVLQRVRGPLLAMGRRPLFSESVRRGQSAMWYGDSAPAPSKVVWGKRRKQAVWAGPAKAPSLDAVLLKRAVAVREQRPRERREHRTSRTVGSRGDPSPADDPDLTPLQRGFLLLLEALVCTRADGLRTFLTFLDMAATRVAAELVRLEEWNEQ
jgi:hypothetical protein